MTNLIKSSYLSTLTHLDISGIQAIDLRTFNRVVTELSNYKYCGNLLSIHMSDLGINFDEAMKEEIMDSF